MTTLSDLFKRRLRLKNLRPISLVYAALCLLPIVVLSAFLGVTISVEVGILAAVLFSAYLNLYLAHRWKEAEQATIEAHLVQTSALIQITSLDLPWRLPLTPMSMRPPDLLDLWAKILVQNPTLVVECGSGVSTLVIAHCLQVQGRGKLISLEHDENWAKLMRQLIVHNNLEVQCQLVLAPLVNSDTAQSRWYDCRVLDDYFTDAKIDFLLVDGPPRISGTLARYPALPYFLDKLSPGANILLDDMDRPDEQAIAARWLAEFPIRHLQSESNHRLWKFQRR